MKKAFADVSSVFVVAEPALVFSVSCCSSSFRTERCPKKEMMMKAFAEASASWVSLPSVEPAFVSSVSCCSSFRTERCPKKKKTMKRRKAFAEASAS